VHNLQQVLCNVARVRIMVRLVFRVRVGVRFRSEIYKLCTAEHILQILRLISRMQQY